jgi:LmbE family N-acetylglucosaminyl deacetylase
VFSAGGTLARLADAGADVTVVTCFTGSVPPADCSPFALSTQLDKGLSADVDYMAMRRVEDDDARAALGGLTGEHLPLLEAPHRGYTSAPDLFAGRHPDDDVAGPLAEALRPWVDTGLVLAPQAVGDHVDHQVVTAVVASLVDPDAVAWWRDTPYAVRHPDAAGLPEARGTEVAVDVAAVLDRKVAATRSYRTQVGFQFGSGDEVAPALAALARAEGDRAGVAGPVEILRCGNRATEILGSLSGAAAGG